MLGGARTTRHNRQRARLAPALSLRTGYGGRVRAALSSRTGYGGQVRAALSPRTTGRQPDRGQVAIEYLGFLPILLALALAAVQLGIAAYTVQQAGTGARAAARTATHDRPVLSPEAAGKASMSDWLADGADINVGGAAFDEVTYTAEVAIPSIIPGVDFGTAKKSATMPRD